MYELPSHDKFNADQRFISNNTPQKLSNILISQIVKIVIMFVFLKKKNEKIVLENIHTYNITVPNSL